MSHMSYLVMPLSRIPRYQLLLKEFDKRNPNNEQVNRAIIRYKEFSKRVTLD